MTAPRSTEERISLWLEEEAAGQLPDRVLEASFERARGSRQARASAWRPFTMSRPISALIAVGAAVIIVAGVIYLRPTSSSNVGVAPPSLSPAPSATSAPSASPSAASIDTSAWTTYASERYGFSIGHPVDWSEDPSEHDWTFENDILAWESTATESFTKSDAGEDLDVRVSAWAAPVAPGTTVEAWIEAYCTGQQVVGPCTGMGDRAVPVETGDGHPGLGVFDPIFDRMAFFLKGDTMYVVAIWREENDPSVQPYGGARRLLEGFLSTMTLPAEPAQALPSAS